MDKFMKLSCQLFLAFLVFQQVYQVTAVGVGCTDAAACTDLCGYAGGGQCINGSYCKCSNCPQRNVFELINLPKVCTLDPTCLCPMSTLSLTSGKVYTGHPCIHLTTLRPTCVCFCMPTTLQSIPDIIKCPFPKTGSSTTTTTPTTTTSSDDTSSSTSTTTEETITTASP